MSSRNHGSFNRLPNPLQSERLIESAELESDGDLAEVVAFVRAGTPDNGINLVPWWTDYLRHEKAESVPARRGGRKFAVLGAGLASGILVGFFVGLTVLGNGVAPVGLPSIGKCSYTPDQLEQLVSVLEPALGERLGRRPDDLVDLSACLACHDFLLKQRLPKSAGEP